MQRRSDPAQFFGTCNCFSISKQSQTFPAAIALATFIVNDSQEVSMVADLVQAEVVPSLRGNQRVCLHNFVCPRTQPDEPTNNQIAIGGMIVILAAFFPPFFRIPAAVLPGFQSCASDP